MFDGNFYINDDQVSILTAGFLAAFITGLFACQWMIKLVRNAQLKYFSYYCFAAGAAAIALQF
jgi:undecaprenyl-diphosphatase